MSIIKKITENIGYLSGLAERDKSVLLSDPDNFAVKLSLRNLEGQINELRQQLFDENSKRQKEIVTLRFKGVDAQFGSLPLLAVGGLTDSFSGAVFEASKFIQFGKKGGKKVEKIVRDTLDLRLNAIGAGSTIFYISAKTSPDLFGDSTTQQTLDNFIEFISSETPEILSERISIVGAASINYFTSFFKRLNENSLEIDIAINSPFRGESSVWEGSADRIINLYTALSALSIGEPVPISFEGRVVSLSSKGKLEIFSNGISYRATYPDDMLDAIRTLHIDQMCRGVFLETKVANSISGKEKSEFELTEIATV